jgi:Na+/H+-dicarboxylate symporter/ABC-type amino acid transport substrate-binding protein
MIKAYSSLSMTAKICLSIFTGLLIGLFFGDYCKSLEFLNNAFIHLIQITIIPYMIFSLIHAIGILDKKTAEVAGKKCGIVLVVFWVISIVPAFLLQFTLPQIPHSAFYTPSSDNAQDVNLINLFIPSNPFFSLANSYVPAIVLFCVLIGAALIDEQKKHALLEQVDFLTRLMKKVNEYISSILPLGILIISAYTFGTVSLDSFQKMLIYVTSSIFYNVFFTFLILPAIAVCSTGISYKKLMKCAFPGVLLAFSTGNVFLALPLIYSSLYQLIEEENLDQPQEEITKRRNLVNVFIPIAWVVPSSYKFLVVFFIIFAGWFYNVPIPFTKQMLLFFAGIPCLFGANALVVPFLLDLGGQPAQAYNFFMLASNFLVYFNNANNAMFIICIVIVCCAVINGQLRIQRARTFVYSAISIITFALAICLLLFSFDRLLSGDSHLTSGLIGMELPAAQKKRYSHIDIKTCAEDSAITWAPRDTRRSLLDQIEESKELRVGFISQSPPFAYINSQKHLVGFDISMTCDLANRLHCNKIIYYPSSGSRMGDLLEKGEIDIATKGGLSADYDAIRKSVLSSPYLELHFAAVIPTEMKQEIPDWRSLKKKKGIKIGVVRGSIFECYGIYIVDHDSLVMLDNVHQYFTDKPCDVLMLSAEEGAVECILHPLYRVVISEPGTPRLHCAFALSSGINTINLRNFVNAWILSNDFINSNYSYWLLGEGGKASAPRWSILGKFIAPSSSFEQ